MFNLRFVAGHGQSLEHRKTFDTSGQARVLAQGLVGMTRPGAYSRVELLQDNQIVDVAEIGQANQLEWAVGQ